MTYTEIQKRNNDYQSLGYQVVWILHDTQFNRRRLSAAEEVLRHHPHYYTNLNASQQGMIYDQYSVDRQAIRWVRSAPMKIDLRQPHFQKINKPPTALPLLILRKKYWELSFSGDLLNPASPSQLQQICHSLENRFPKPPRESLRGILSLSYRILFRALLEKTCD